MIRNLIICAAMLLGTGFAFGQSGTTILWTWTAPSTGAAPAVYNFYQAPGSCATPGSFVKIASVTATTWTQPSLLTGVTCSRVTAVSAVGVEGPPSPTFQFDATPPGAPGTPQGKIQ